MVSGRMGASQTVGSSASKALDVMFYAIQVYGWDVFSFRPELPERELPDIIKNASQYELQWLLVEILMRL